MRSVVAGLWTSPAFFRRDSVDATPTAAEHAPSRGGRWRPRVLMVVESSSGGTGRHVIDLCRGLADRGCEVHLIFSIGRVDRLFLERVAALDGVCCTPVKMRTGIHPSDFGAAMTVRRYLYEFGPFDVVHGHSSKGGAIARLGALGTGVPAFYTLHGLIMMDPELSRTKRRLYLAIERLLATGTEKIIAVSPEEQRAAVRVGLGGERVVLIPNGVGAAELSPRDAARVAIGAGDDELVIGFVGRFVTQKAPHVLLGAMKRVIAAAPNVKLAMVGGGPLEESLRAFATQAGVADRILWLGERDARTVMAGFDVFAIPSCKEGLPYVVLEAMAAGLPIVATDTAGVECLVSTGVNGTVVPCGDVAALGNALLSLARDPERVRQYGAASLRRVARFTVDAMVDRTLAAYAGERVEAHPAAAERVVDVEAEELEELAVR